MTKEYGGIWGTGECWPGLPLLQRGEACRSISICLRSWVSLGTDNFLVVGNLYCLLTADSANPFTLVLPWQEPSKETRDGQEQSRKQFPVPHVRALSFSDMMWKVSVSPTIQTYSFCQGWLKTQTALTCILVLLCFSFEASDGKVSVGFSWFLHRIFADSPLMAAYEPNHITE